MDASAPCKKRHSILKNEWPKLIPQKKPERLKEQMVGLSSNKWYTTLKNRRLKNVYYLYKNLMLQIDPLNSSYSQKLEHLKRQFRPH